MELEQQHRETLSVLGYLYLRMGELDRAGRLFSALLALGQETDSGQDMPSWVQGLVRLAHASLAVVELERGNARASLEHLHQAMDGQVLSSRHAALHLLRARALWQQGRQDEARLAVEAFVHLTGQVKESASHHSSRGKGA